LLEHQGVETGLTDARERGATDRVERAIAVRRAAAASTASAVTCSFWV
jgi:hypothetical protein